MSDNKTSKPEPIIVAAAGRLARLLIKPVLEYLRRGRQLLPSPPQSDQHLKLWAQVFREAHEGIMITDATRRIVEVNPTFSEITGYDKDEAVGKSPAILKSGIHPAEFYVQMWANLDEQGYWKGELWNRKKSGELYAELATISAIHDEDGQITHYVGLFSDITQTKHIQLALERMAHHDALTGLPNRVLFADRFAQAIARCKRDEAYLAICYLDLDGFKAVNDNLGHKAGDHLLVEVAARLKSIMRQEDTIARLGGDEFGLLMCEIQELEQCELAMERIQHIVSQPYQIDGLRVVIGLSSGVTLYPLDDADPDTLLRHADHAMYLAKQGGRNRYKIFDPETMT